MMQHWHVYTKWNERFFKECFKAYKQGRMASNPSQKWYEGEIGFYDFYIIPLAKKLDVSGVFGVSSAEYLDYAEKNRAGKYNFVASNVSHTSSEWEEKGQEVVAGMVKRANLMYKTTSRRGSL